MTCDNCQLRRATSHCPRYYKGPSHRSNVSRGGAHSGDAHPRLTAGLWHEDRADVPTSIQLSRSSDPKHVTITS